MPIHIVNDGGPSYTTRIFDAETDQDITALLHVTRIDLVLDVPSMPVATLSCYAPKVNVTVNEAQVTQVCPYCGREKTSTLHSAKDIEQPESDIYSIFLTSLDEARKNRGNPTRVSMNSCTFHSLMNVVAPNALLPASGARTIYGLEIVLDAQLPDRTFKMSGNK